LPDEATRQAQRKALNDRGGRLAYEAARREILRALYSPAQLQEQLTWLWLDHFSVFQYKANDAWLVADYADTAIRPHALGTSRPRHGESYPPGHAAVSRQCPERRGPYQRELRP